MATHQIGMNALTHLMSPVSFYTPLKAPENKSFSDVCKGGKERDQWHEID